MERVPESANLCRLEWSTLSAVPINARRNNSDEAYPRSSFFPSPPDALAFVSGAEPETCHTAQPPAPPARDHAQQSRLVRADRHGPRRTHRRAGQLATERWRTFCRSARLPSALLESSEPAQAQRTNSGKVRREQRRNVYQIRRQ